MVLCSAADATTKKKCDVKGKRKLLEFSCLFKFKAKKNKRLCLDLRRIEEFQIIMYANLGRQAVVLKDHHVQIKFETFANAPVMALQHHEGFRI